MIYARNRVAFLVAAAALVGTVAAQSLPVELSLTGQPASHLLRGAPYVIGGYGQAKFGMDLETLRQVLANEFPGSVASLVDTGAGQAHGQGLSMTVPALRPGPGPASLVYELGAGTCGLHRVEVRWTSGPVASKAEQQALIAAARVLVADLRGYQWPPFESGIGHVPNPLTLIPFAGRDANKHRIEVKLIGVEYDLAPRLTADKKHLAYEHRTPAPGQAQLVLTVEAPCAA